ncbi:MAG: hypothetical protein ACOX7R_11300 [Acetivibrionales bacterium]
MDTIENGRSNSELLFFILIYLLLFYDSSCIGILSRRRPEGNSSVLFFILIFLLLFY